MTEKTTTPKIAEEKEKFSARIATDPSTNAAAVIISYSKAFGEQEPQALYEILLASIEKVTTKGDMTRPEAMLMGQAEALQAIFVNLARTANNQEYIKNTERFLKLALKAQSQCRSTLEALATIKNPPIVYAHQANIAHGHQQVNNNQALSVAPMHAEKNKIDQNELLEVKNDEWVDCGTSAKTSAINQAMAPVGKINGSDNQRR